MQDDFFGIVLEKCHERGIRVIARFDFSKTDEKFLKEHPEWYSRKPDGEPVLFNGTAATCVNGAYQQECSLKILEEVIARYPVDGVFFNMFGYQTVDYSGHYIGICQCENCRKKFREYSGAALPTVEDNTDPVYRKYREFKKATTHQLLEKIYRHVKKLNPNVAVCTYCDENVDLIRSESNSAVDRPLPFWFYASEDNVSRVEVMDLGVHSCNCAINAVDIFYRFMGVSQYLNELRILGDMACGGNLDWCIIGDFESYPDRTNFQGVKDVFQFHIKYEKYFNNLETCASVLLMAGSSMKRDEFRGIFKMLKEEHVTFDVIPENSSFLTAEFLDSYRIVILPGINHLEEKTIEMLEKSHAHLIATGMSLKDNPKALGELFGGRKEGEIRNKRGCYLSADEKDIFKHFKDRDWLYIDGDFMSFIPLQENTKLLPLIEGGGYAPPEKCYGYRITNTFGLSIRPERGTYIPWELGALYYKHGYEDYRFLLVDILGYLSSHFHISTAPSIAVKIDAPACVESFISRCGKNQYLIQFLNYSGFNGMTFSSPLPVETMVNFGKIRIRSLKELDLKEPEKPVKTENGTTQLLITGLYKALLLTTEE